MMILPRLLFIFLGLLLPLGATSFAHEKARATLERLFKKGSSDTAPTAVLTAVARRQREVEMDLLLKLARSNDALPLLEDLWVSEQNVDPDALAKAAMRDDTLMEEYPSWVIPAYQQASKAFREKDLAAAYRLALQALKRKPWHIPTNYLMFNIAWKKSDLVQAKYWAQRCMPRNPDHRRRQAWVANVMEQAKIELQLLEQKQDKFWESANEWQ